MGLRVFFITFMVASPSIALAAQPAKMQSVPRIAVNMHEVTPESVGFSSRRLQQLHLLMQGAVDHQQIAGAVTLLARHGKAVDYRAYGMRDIASKTPMTKDTIFRDYSMTKVVTGVAMMILYEQGRWMPSDPIAKYVPEFAHLKVYNGVDASGKMILVDPVHPPTMAELMTHTAGFTYGHSNDPVGRLVRDAKIFQSSNLHEFVNRLSRIPLLYQPGTKWVYSPAVDIQGYIIEKLTGKTLPEFMRENIFAPLGMRDAGFYVPHNKWFRFASLYWVDHKNGGLTDTGKLVEGLDFTHQPSLPSGGGGMVSTAEDYYRFAQMLGNGGILDSKRILAPASVHLMSANHLPANLLTGEFRMGPQVMRPGFGYGYDCAVVYDPPTANLPGGKGTFFWYGAANTWFWIDPTNDIVFVGMIQRIGTDPKIGDLQYLSRGVIYGALVNPTK